MIDLVLSELDVRSLAALADSKAKRTTRDRPYWSRLRDELLANIPAQKLAGLKDRTS